MSSEAGRYRKKQVEVEALRWTGENREAIQRFLGDAVTVIVEDSVARTWHGEAAPGDYFARTGGRVGYTVMYGPTFDAEYERIAGPDQPEQQPQGEERSHEIAESTDGSRALFAPSPPASRQAAQGAEEFEDQFDSCDNCDRLVLEKDLKVIWCRDGESGEQVDARICLICRLEAEKNNQGEELSDEDREWREPRIYQRQHVQYVRLELPLREVKAVLGPHTIIAASGTAVQFEEFDKAWPEIRRLLRAALNDCDSSSPESPAPVQEGDDG